MFTETYTHSFVYILQLFLHTLNVLRKLIRAPLFIFGIFPAHFKYVYGNLYMLLCSYFASFPAHLKCFTETCTRSFVHIWYFSCTLKKFSETYTCAFVHILYFFLHTLNVLRKSIHAGVFS